LLWVVLAESAAWPIPFGSLPHEGWELPDALFETCFVPFHVVGIPRLSSQHFMKLTLPPVNARDRVKVGAA
jgi:hypothetical protein